MKKVFEYGGLSAPLDMTDYVVAERVQNAVVALEAVKEKLTPDKPVFEQMKLLFHAYAQVLIDATGDENAANLALGGSTSLDEVISAVFALTDFARAQNEAFTAHLGSSLKQFEPRKGRAKG